MNVCVSNEPGKFLNMGMSDFLNQKLHNIKKLSYYVWYTKSESSKVGNISKLILMKRNSVLPHEVIKLSILINCIYFIVVDIVDHLSSI